MAGFKFKEFLKAGHAPTLFSAFLYFDFCFAVWVLNGAMAPYISEHFNLSPAQKGFMISVPILAGAFMRFPLGLLAQYIGRKAAAMVEMSLIMLALCYGYFMVETYSDVLIMGVLLGIAGASFGVALSLGSGSFPPKYKGLAMGISGAGNSGTVLAVLFAPPLAEAYGWQTVYGFAAFTMLIPMVVMLIFAKEPADREHQTLKEHLKCLWEKDGWVFNLVYIITFGGFIGLSNFLPTYFHDQFGVTKIQAGQLTMLAALMGSAIRVVGGFVSDRWGGINTLTLIFGLVIICMFVASFHLSLVSTTILFMLCFAALGAGNGALFQLVPLRWPLTTAVAGSMIGEIGALGGGFIPNVMGQSKQITGEFSAGFLAFVGLALVALVILRVAQRSWVKTWVAKGGIAKVKPKGEESVEVETMIKPKQMPGYQPATGLNGLGFHTIIYPVGNSELTDKANKTAASIALMSDAELILVFVEDKWQNAGVLASGSEEWSQIREQWNAEGKSILDEEEQKMAALGVSKIKKVFRSGSVSDEIVAEANARNADLIILASHKQSPIGKLLMGSRTYGIFQTANCPIVRIVR